MDGAGTCAPLLRSRTLAPISPTFFLLLVLNVATSFTEVASASSTSRPRAAGNATQTMVYKIHKDGFIGLDLPRPRPSR